jgi:leader peptidase (prepilin peptidase)/N-methyltransferase
MSDAGFSLTGVSGAIFFDVVAFLFGLLIGSFLNVCIYRMPRDLSVVRPRSHCPHCRRTIAWYDNLPVLSYLLLRARCRHCFAAIPARYVLVELSTGLVFLFSVVALGPTLAAAKYAVFCAIMIALIVTDYLDRILPDEFTLGGIVLGLAFAPFTPAEPGLLQYFLPRSIGLPWIRLADATFAAALCWGMIWFVGWAYQKIRHREGMGFGDVKMMAMIGAFLGIRGAFPTMIFGSMLGSVLGLGYILIRKKNAATYELPFGSFLGTAALVVAMFAAWHGRVS